MRYVRPDGADALAARVKPGSGGIGGAAPGGGGGGDTGPGVARPLVTGGVVSWYLTDRQGSTRALTDAAGAVQDRLTFDGYGGLTSETVASYGDRYKYTGREYDPAAKLQYNRDRWYDARTGRWTSEDPAGFDAGDTNLNRYIGNGPTNGTDPSGRALLASGSLASAKIDAAYRAAGQQLDFQPLGPTGPEGRPIYLAQPTGGSVDFARADAFVRNTERALNSPPGDGGNLLIGTSAAGDFPVTRRIQLSDLTVAQQLAYFKAEAKAYGPARAAAWYPALSALAELPDPRLLSARERADFNVTYGYVFNDPATKRQMEENYPDEYESVQQRGQLQVRVPADTSLLGIARGPSTTVAARDLSGRRIYETGLPFVDTLNAVTATATETAKGVLSNREFQDTLQLVGTALEAFEGALLLVTPGLGVTQAAGVVLLAHASDTLQAKLRGSYQGKHVQTLTHDVAAGLARKAGFSATGADIIGVVIDAGVPLVATVAGGVGRAAALARLDKSGTRVGRGAEVVLAVGEAGEGKSLGTLVKGSAGAEVRTARLTEEELFRLQANAPLKGAASETEALLNAARKVCFPAGTLVSTGAGLKRIEELTTADEVWAFDHKRLVWRLRKVLQTFTHDHDGPLVTVEAGDEKIDATGGHPFWVVRGEALEYRPLPKLISAREPGGRQEGRWVLAKDLRVGDELLLRSGERMLVAAASTVDRQLLVYNIHVEEFENYSVGHCGILVHNTNEIPEELAARLRNTSNLPPWNADRRAAEQALNEHLARKFGPLEVPGGPISKSNSPVWKDTQPFRGQTKTNGLSGNKRRYYESALSHENLIVT